MEKNFNKIDACTSEVEVTLTKEELEPHYFAAYKRVQPTVDIAGFRKGKVPIKLVKERFGEAIEAEAEQDIINDEFNKIIKEDKLKVVGQPTITDIAKNDNGLTFKIVYEVIPDFDLADYKGITLDEPVHVVSDEEIEYEIEQICVNNGSFEDEEQVADELFVVGLKLEEIDKNTKEKIKDIDPIDQHIFLKDQTVLPDLKQSVMNTKVGDTFEFNPHDTDKGAPDKLYTISIQDIQRLIPVEFTNDFVSQYTKEKFNTTEEFREEIGFQLQEQWDQKSRQALEHQIIDTLVDIHDFEAPRTIVNTVMETMVDDLKKRYEKSPDIADITVEKMQDDLLPVAERNVKWEILRNMIIEKEDLKVEQHDLDELIQSEAKRMNVDKELIAKAITQNPNLAGSVLTKKVIDLVLDFAITNEIEFEDHKHDHEHLHDHDHDHDHDEENEQD